MRAATTLSTIRTLIRGIRNVHCLINDVSLLHDKRIHKEDILLVDVCFDFDYSTISGAAFLTDYEENGKAKTAVLFFRF